MKKLNSFRHLALIGFCSGFLMAQQLEAKDTPAASPEKAETKNDSNPNDGNMGYHLMTEEELFLELSPDGIAMYKTLTPEGKELARKVASMRCNQSNLCAGLNACETEKNKCAGKGSCKETGKCAISDKNLAVKLVRDKMAKKREEITKPK